MLNTHSHNIKDFRVAQRKTAVAKLGVKNACCIIANYIMVIKQENIITNTPNVTNHPLLAL